MHRLGQELFFQLAHLVFINFSQLVGFVGCMTLLLSQVDKAGAHEVPEVVEYEAKRVLRSPEEAAAERLDSLFEADVDEEKFGLEFLYGLLRR